MPFVAANPNARLGEVVGTGHCLPFVQLVAGVPHSSRLRRGEHVLSKGDDLARGTIIGTFNQQGLYANAVDGSSHVAILLERRPEGLWVVDQWRGKAVGTRLIRDKKGVGPAVDDASRYHVVEAA